MLGWAQALCLGAAFAGGDARAMKTLRILMLAVLFASCHLDALFKGAGGGAGGGGSPAGGPKARLTFADQPSQVTAGQVLAPVRVAVLDSAGQPLSDYTGTVTIALANAGGATLAGTQSVDVVGGVAAFTDLTIDKAGSYALRATATGAATATSAPIEVIPPPPPPPGATHLGFERQPPPQAAQAGSVLAPVLVAALDASENVVSTFTGLVTLDLSSNPGGAALAGSRTANAVDGVATFSDLSLDKAGSGYRLRATSPGLSDATSASFDITSPPPPPGGATHLGFSDQPAITQVGRPTWPVRVTVYDDAGNQVRSFTGDVTLSIGYNPSGGTLTGGGTITMDLGLAGVAEWDNVTIDQPGNGYILRATSPGLRDGFSDPLDITADPPPPPNGATGLGYMQVPTTTRAGDVIAPAVKIVGVNGNTGTVAPGYNGPVWVSMGANPTGATLSGTRRVMAVNGWATFPDLRIDKPGRYTLRATAWPLNYKASPPFDITAAAPAPGLRTGVKPARPGAKP